MSRFFIILTHPFVCCGSTSKGATFNKLIYRINRITFIERRQGQFLQPRRHSHRLDLLSLPGTGRLHAMNGSLLNTGVNSPTRVFTRGHHRAHIPALMHIVIYTYLFAEAHLTVGHVWTTARLTLSVSSFSTCLSY